MLLGIGAGLLLLGAVGAGIHAAEGTWKIEDGEGSRRWGRMATSIRICVVQRLFFFLNLMLLKWRGRIANGR